MIAFYGFHALFGTTNQSHSSIETAIEIYASPMATIIRVIRTKITTSMPFTMGVVNVLNSVSWGINGGLIHNIFLLAPNIVGAILSLTQMLVTYIYRSKGSQHGHLMPALTDGTVESVIVAASQQENGDDYTDAYTRNLQR